MKTNSRFLFILISTLILISCTHDDEPLTLTDPSIEAYKNALMSNGGIMYDKFWSTESTFDQNNTYLSTLSEFSNFFRCKQCHGWDGLGNQGAYISRSPKTTRPNVTGINLFELGQTESPQLLFDVLKKTANRRDISEDLTTYDPETNNITGDKMPNLNQLLTDKQIWDLVKFMKEGMFDVSDLYDASYTGSYPNGSMVISNVGKDGDASKGTAYYTSNCVSCHGVDGTTLTLEDKTLGKFTRTKANEVQHKIRYGQLGSSMTGKFNITLSEMKDLYKSLANEIDFPD